MVMAKDRFMTLLSLVPVGSECLQIATGRTGPAA